MNFSDSGHFSFLCKVNNFQSDDVRFCVQGSVFYKSMFLNRKFTICIVIYITDIRRRPGVRACAHAHTYAYITRAIDAHHAQPNNSRALTQIEHCTNYEQTLHTYAQNRYKTLLPLVQRSFLAICS